MPTLTIRNVTPEVHHRLRIQAARAGRSMEAEARAILEKATADHESDFVDVLQLPDWVRQLYVGTNPPHVVDDLIADRRREQEREA